jgi:hypothetical protein
VAVSAQDSGEPDPVCLVVVDDEDSGQARRCLSCLSSLPGSSLFATRNAA